MRPRRPGAAENGTCRREPDSRLPRRAYRLGRLSVPVGILALAAAAFLLVPGGNASAADSLLSRGRYATSSSNEGQGYVPRYAFDGDTTTRWSSQASDPQWIEVDLGAVSTISSVRLAWEAAYGRDFQIQVSTDNAAWTTVKSVTGSTGGTQTYAVAGNARYVRMYGTARGTGYGYSLGEFEVYGTTGASDPVTGGQRHHPGTPDRNAGHLLQDRNAGHLLQDRRERPHQRPAVPPGHPVRGG